MGTTGTVPLQSAIADQLITSALWNAEFANIGTLMDAAGCGGHSSTDAEAQIQTAPFPGSVLSKATSIAGELERIRNQLAAILGTDYWYKPAATNLTSVGNVVVPIGGVIDFPVVTPPNASWHLADGTAISRSIYATLFALIGTTFGAGDASTTFNLPNYTDRMSIAAGNLYAGGATGGAVSNTPAISITDPGHNHTQNSHTHTMGNHTHSTPAHIHTLDTVTKSASSSATSQYLKDDGTGAMAVTSGAGTGTVEKNTTVSGGSGTSGTPSSNTSDAATPTNNSNTTGITATSALVPTLPPYLGMYKLIRVL